jgi:dUTP pyrophosphatase
MSLTVLRVKLLRPGARLPARATPGASGFDLYACVEGGGYIDLGRDVTLVPTGIAIEVPPGVDVQVRPRSGLGRRGVNVVLGTIDADYRGELLVSMYTFGSRSTYTVKDGDRIAQLVITRLESIELALADQLSPSTREAGGHGSTGR